MGLSGLVALAEEGIGKQLLEAWPRAQCCSELASGLQKSPKSLGKRTELGPALQTLN